MRFDKNVHGILAAARHFFDMSSGEISKSIAFVLIERVSNVKQAFRGQRFVNTCSMHQKTELFYEMRWIKFSIDIKN